MTRIKELQNVIRKLHGVESKHVESVPVKETFQGKTVWDGTVEVFELHGHPQASKLYAWTHQTDNPKKPKRHVTVLHVQFARGAIGSVVSQRPTVRMFGSFAATSIAPPSS